MRVGRYRPSGAWIYDWSGTGAVTTMDQNPATNLPRGFGFGAFQAPQAQRLAPNELKPSWTPAMAYLKAVGDPHAEGEVRHRSG